MTKEETKERIAVMQAYVDGKQVQVYDILGGKWFDTDAPSWFISSQFRIKPGPSCRPFRNAEECWKEMQKHVPFGWVKFLGTYSAVVAVSNVDVSVVTTNGDVVVYPFVVVKEDHTFADGTPFGIKED